MTSPRVWKRGLVSLGAVLAVVWVAGSAQAEVKFRKKAPPAAADGAGLEGSPSGGEATEGAAADGKPAEGATGGVPSAQADDKDFPEAQAQKEKARADAALARQARNAQLAKKKEEGTPFYAKWQFWAITGGVIVGGILASYAGYSVYHQANGGDIRQCMPTMSPAGCYGEGR